MVPRRLDEIVESGTGTAMMDWIVGDETVRKVAGDTPPVELKFHAGDAIIFDELNLHSSKVRLGMKEDRLSTETWFFAESTFPPDTWVPIAI